MSLSNWFKPKVTYSVVELEKPVPRLSHDDSINIASLAEHPGFHALLGRLRIQKSLLESTLRTHRHESLQEVYNLQAGINWINWLDRQVQQMAGRKETPPRTPFELEEAEFRRMTEALSFVGKEQP